MDYKITNVKLSVKCKNISLDSVFDFCLQQNIPFTKFNNFLVLKSNYTYIIFKKSTKNIHHGEYHINITKIPSFEKISDCMEFLKRLSPAIKLLSLKVDNISVSYNLNCFVDIIKLQSSAKGDCDITYNKETFPGLFLKFKKGYGTAIVFYTGKCVLLGSKNASHVENIVEKLLTFVKNK